MLVPLREDLSESSFQKKLFTQFKEQTILLTGDILFQKKYIYKAILENDSKNPKEQ
jgi:hypothetical protein